jgi:hypothetical protein
MFRQMLYVQWKWSRDILLFFVVACFATPFVVTWLVVPVMGGATPRQLVRVGESTGGALMVLSLLLGGSIAALGWIADARSSHVYALTLPIGRRRFLAFRALGASCLFLVPALATWLGGVILGSQLTLPDALDLHAATLAWRVLLAATLAHAVVFAFRYTTGERARHYALAFLLGCGAVGISMLFFPGMRDDVSRILFALFRSPGPFGLLTSGWSLIDV